MPTRRYPALLALLLLLVAPNVVSAQGAAPGVAAALTPDGLRLTLACPAPAPPMLEVEVSGRPPVVVTPVAEPPAPLSLALVIERSAAMGEAGTPYSSRLADAVMLATALLDRAPPGSQVSLLSFDDVAARTLVAPTLDLGAARGALTALETFPAGQNPPSPAGVTLADGGPAAALSRADALLASGPAGPRAIVVFAAGALPPGGLRPLVSGPRLTFVELSGADAEAAGQAAAVAGARDVVHLPYHTDDSAALPALFAAYQRHGAELLGEGRLSLTVPISGLGPGRHEVRVLGCGVPQTGSFEAPAAASRPALLLAACALPAFGLGYGLWRRRRAEGRAGGEPDTVRYRSPLEVTTARREATASERAELCAVVWDGRERRAHRLTARQTTIGRDAGCAIRIESEWVSGLHARLSLAGEEVEIIDLESTNGTFIGDPGRPLAPGVPAALALGEVARIGPDVRLVVYRSDPEQAGAPLEQLTDWQLANRRSPLEQGAPQLDREGALNARAAL
jgi:hypothetical protein